ncbi:LOW QUALITY PROTEIN: hypothetical protein CVT25_010430 [Psilocybe cyanescens]|uniref:Poly [ADP-ribose] polymerase n=1 Tax=Psilocybe cyanescens TaxID=93625 RepID=A0A409XNU3_PSICY|nr:LOW QUALITY PROTEIN: hypothetical protein CVT25_010430 [Psilocybe cyanescens]
MPPRKKATADDAAPAPARSSARIKAAVSTQPADASAGTSAPQPVAPAQSDSKGKSKRTRSATTTQDEAAPKPASKRAKKGKAADIADDIADLQPAAQNGSTDDSKPLEEEKKMVTVLKRGAAPVDPASNCVDTHQVYSNEQGVWDAMLNQTDVSGNQNKNKSLLHPIGNNTQCKMFTRWGRVGENGQTQTKGPWPAQQAVNEFKKQFRSKAAVAWEDRHGMVPRPERDYGDEDEPEKDDKNDESSKSTPLLKRSAQHLIGYTGKLAKSTILNGFAALKTLADVIQNPTGATANQYGGMRAACEHLSGAYYSVIPHDFGRQRPMVIDNATALKRELDLVDALGDMVKRISFLLRQSRTDLQQGNCLEIDLIDEFNIDGNPINPIDSHFRSLGLTSMEPIAKDSPEFKSLVDYARDTHGATHRYKATVRNAFRVERAGEAQAWDAKNFSDLPAGDRLLLWHGSRTTNFAGILKQGLRIAPPEAYDLEFSLSNGTGLLLLCEVAAKPFHELTNGSYNADEECKNAGKLATKGIGRTQPVAWKDAGMALNHVELSGCEMPAGPGQDVPGVPGLYLQYNEYIVYDPSQIRLRYLLMVDM